FFDNFPWESLELLKKRKTNFKVIPSSATRGYTFAANSIQSKGFDDVVSFILKTTCDKKFKYCEEAPEN
ncbi:MAG: hypothetical protein ACTSU5_12185, partial [Promethearchaeota archaeon]